MSEIACPACVRASEPAARIGPLAVCGLCGASVVVEPDGTVRRATARDTDGLALSELAILSTARARLVRGERRT